jgi:hypothetical protein
MPTKTPVAAATKTKQNKRRGHQIFSSVVAFASNDLIPNNDLHPARK